MRLSILEIRNPEVEATLVARSIAEQLEKRVSFRRAMKQAVQKSMRAGAKGIKVVMGGRLGGAEIARTEKEVDGSVPLQTLRADIDYGVTEAHTTYGLIGVKVWIYRGDVLPDRQGGVRPPPMSEALLPSGERGARPERGERGGRGGRGSGGASGERGGAGGERRGGRTGGGAGGERAGSLGGERRGPATGERAGSTRAPRPGGTGGTTGRAGGGTGTPRMPRAPGSGRGATGASPVGASRQGTDSPAPEGTIPTDRGPDPLSSSPVSPSPAAREAPAPTVNPSESPSETPRRESVERGSGEPES